MATYINAKLRKAIDNNDTKTINRELFGLFRQENPDYKIGVSDSSIYREWVKAWIEENTKSDKELIAKEQPKPKAKSELKSKAESKSEKHIAKEKSKAKAKSESKSQPKSETQTDIIAKLKADYINGEISAQQFANTLAILCK